MASGALAPTASLGPAEVAAEPACALDAATVAMADLEGGIVHWSRGRQEPYGWYAAKAVDRDKHELLASRYIDEAAPGAIRTRAPNEGRSAKRTGQIGSGRHDVLAGKPLDDRAVDGDQFVDGVGPAHHLAGIAVYPQADRYDARTQVGG